MRRIAAAVACAAVVLSVGLTAPTHAVAVPHQRGAAEQTVTLITGGRVSVGAKGQLGSIERAPGRERIPVRIQSVDGHTFAVPVDAQRLIADGNVSTVAIRDAYFGK